MRRVEVVLQDDLSGETADQSVLFGLDGVQYEIDLTDANAEKLRAALGPFVEAGRLASRVQGKGKAVASPASQRIQQRNEDKDIREWAKRKGIPISDRGRIAQDTRDFYANRDTLAATVKASERPAKKTTPRQAVKPPAFVPAA